MIVLKCKTCGKEFKVIPCRKDTAKYCSKECASIGLHGDLNCKCDFCGKLFHRKPQWKSKNKNQFCSRECSNQWKKINFCGANNHQFGLKGNLNSSYKGKEIEKNNNGFLDVRVYAPNHPFKDKDSRVLKHRLIVEENHIKFNPKYFIKIDNQYYLKKTTEIHHINFNHNDNRIENLIPLTKSEHRAVHNLNCVLIRDNKGKITGVLKQGELLEKPEEVDQQPSLNSDILEGSETNNRVLRDSNVDTSALPA